MVKAELVPKLSRFELDQLREALDQLKLDNSSEPIVLIMWVVAGVNEPSYNDCLQWEAAETGGITHFFTRAIEESVDDFQSRVEAELETMFDQLTRESGFYQYCLRPIPDYVAGR